MPPVARRARLSNTTHPDPASGLIGLRGMRRPASCAQGWLLALPAMGVLALFFVVPVVAVTVDALREGTGAFARVFATAGFSRALAGSALLTLVAAAVSTVVGLAVAVHLARLPPRRRTALSFVIALPLTFSG